MDLEEEIAWKIRNDCNMYIRQGRKIAHVIMPLVKRAQAEALREASTWVENLAAHDGLMYRDDGHGDSVATSIPDALRNRADQIEKEAGA